MTDTDNRPEGARRSHLAPFTESFRPWLVLARNAIPVAGVYWFSWTAREVVLQIWFDGATALAAMMAFQMAAFAAREKAPGSDLPPGMPLYMRPVMLALIWLVIMLLLGSPYWFLFMIFSFVAEGMPGILASASSIYVALLAVLVGNIVEEASRGYGRMTDTEIRVEFNWYFSMHLARVCVIIMSLFLIPFGFVIPLLLGLSYVEIYPMRSLRFFGGESTLDPENESRSSD